MAQYDLLIYQNTAPTGITYTERYINIPKGGLISSDTNSVPTILSAGPNGYFLKSNSATTTGLEWTSVGVAYLLTDVTTKSTRCGINAGLNETQGSGRYNTMVGHEAGYSLTIGTSNTFLGYQAGYGMTGSYNIAIGTVTGAYSNTGNYNIFMGTQVGGSSGNYNISIGHLAFNGGGDANLTVGYSSGYSLTSGASNVLIGHESGALVTSGAGNTCLGYESGRSMATSNYNVFLGYWAGYYETGSNKLFIDNQSRGSEAESRTNALIYGVFNSTITSQQLWLNSKVYTGQLVVSSSTTLSLDITMSSTTITDPVAQFKHGATTGTTIKLIVAKDGGGNERGYINMNITTSTLTFVSSSDIRLKTNININTIDALSIINNIPVKNFNFKEKPNDEPIMGFIAQDVQKFFPQAVHYNDSKDTLDLSWGYSMNPLYHKAIQELYNKVYELEKTIKEYQNTKIL